MGVVVVWFTVGVMVMTLLVVNSSSEVCPTVIRRVIATVWTRSWPGKGRALAMTALDMFCERQREFALLFAAVKLAGVFHVIYIFMSLP